MSKLDHWFDFSNDAKETYTLDRLCLICNEMYFVVVDAVKYRLWDSGSLIQDVWSDLSAGQREMIKLGYHQDCWEEMFSSEEDDE